MNITLTGATGFIGTRLIHRLQADGHVIRVLGRRVPNISGIQFFEWNAGVSEPPEAAFEGADAVVHMSGEPVSQRWNPEVKQRIIKSRTDGTRQLVQALSTISVRPKVLVSASAIGYYGDRGEEVLREASAAGEGFLSTVCEEWEREARLAEALGIRVALLRIGIVLGAGGGALKEMLPPFRFGLGGRIGSGQQWMSWIHLDDLVEMIYFLIREEKIRGPVNGTAPEPVRNADFTKALGAALHRPAVLPVPKFGLKLLFGEMADVMFYSQRAIPEKALQGGFQFRYSKLEPALAAIL